MVNSIRILGSDSVTTIEFIQIARTLHVFPILSETSIVLPAWPIFTLGPRSLLERIAGSHFLEPALRIAGILETNIRVHWKSVCRITEQSDFILTSMLVDQTGRKAMVVISPRGLYVSIIIIDS